MSQPRSAMPTRYVARTSGDAMADVQVTIGATLDELISHVEGAKDIIAGLGEALGTGLSVAMLTDVVAKFAEMAEHIERMSVILGISTSSVQELSVIAKMTGGDADALAMSMERLQLGLARGQVATSAQAAAMRALGINFQQFVAAKPDEQMNMLADAVSKFADGGTKTANVLLLAGRGAAQLIPVLDQGRAGLERLRQEAESTGAVMSTRTVAALAELDRATISLKASLTGLAGTFIGQLAPAMTEGIRSFQQWVAVEMTAVNSGKVFERAIADMQYMLASLALSVAHGAQLLSDFFHLDWAAVKADWARGESEQQDLLKQHFAKMAEINRQGMLLLSDKPENQPFKPAAPTADLGAAQRMKDALQNAQEAIKLAEGAFKYEKDLDDARVKTFQITEQQKTQALITALATRQSAELEAIDDAEKNIAQGSAEWKRAENERMLISQRAADELIRINAQAAEKTQQAWLRAADRFAADFSAALDQVLKGQASFSQAMVQMFGKMIEQMIAQLIKLIAEYAILDALAAASGGAAPSFAALSQKVLGFAEGTPFVQRSGMALVHQGEAIIPAQANPFGAGGGGATTNNYGGSPSLSISISAMDAASVQQLFTSRGHEIVNWLTPHLTRPSFNGQ